MKIMSLARLAEEVAYASQDKRNLSGSIQNVGKFQENAAALDLKHHGIYAFLAFHPGSDRAVLKYLGEGTLGDDAGPNILALFLSPDWVAMPRRTRPSDAEFGIKLSAQQHPAYELARGFYPANAQPAFPGLIFFNSLSQPRDAVYVVIEGADAASVRKHCRAAFEAANAALIAPPADGKKDFWSLDSDRLAAKLSGIPMKYQRSEGTTLRGVRLIAGVWMQKNAKALVMAIPKIVQWGVGLKTGGDAK
jgi:hypothetical protein